MLKTKRKRKKKLKAVITCVRSRGAVVGFEFDQLEPGQVQVRRRLHGLAFFPEKNQVFSGVSVCLAEREREGEREEEEVRKSQEISNIRVTNSNDMAFGMTFQRKAFSRFRSIRRQKGARKIACRRGLVERTEAASEGRLIAANSTVRH